jgi:hypothetical protein
MGSFTDAESIIPHPPHAWPNRVGQEKNGAQKLHECLHHCSHLVARYISAATSVCGSFVDRNQKSRKKFALSIRCGEEGGTERRAAKKNKKPHFVAICTVANCAWIENCGNQIAHYPNANLGGIVMKMIAPVTEQRHGG